MHSCWCHGLLAGVVKQCGLTVVLWGHNEFLSRSWEEQRVLRSPPEGVIANSHFTARTFAEALPNVPCKVVRCAASAPDISDAAAARITLRRELGIPPETVVILQASRMEEWKGQRLHLEALARVSARVPWIALFAGGAQRPSEEKYEASLKRQRETLKLGTQVHFLGQRRDVPALMIAADIFCQPNAAPEPFGLVFIEALYAGRPTVTFSFGGAAEIVDDHCGVLVEPGNVTALADALTALIDDPIRRRALGAAGPDRAKELCDPSGVLRALDTTLREFGIISER